MPSVARSKTRSRGDLGRPVEDEMDRANHALVGPASSDLDADSAAASDSDSLDSVSPRKRRRTSPTAVDGADDDEPKIIKSAFNVPSRIKRNKPQAGKAAEDVQAQDPEPEPTTGVTAPVDVNTTFESLGVRPWLVQSLANMAIKRPTAIQRESIPMLLKGRDCIGGSRTGSGKTVAFSAPILQKWAENPSAIFAVILTPTR